MESARITTVYHTRKRLRCPFHTMAYRTEIEHRARKAPSLFHSKLQAGHTNFMESSHNILIRFRSKHIQLEKVHYELSTDLGLLQANLTVMKEKKGPQYHWIPDLFQRLVLQLYEGVQEALERYIWPLTNGQAKAEEKGHKKSLQKVMRVWL